MSAGIGPTYSSLTSDNIIYKSTTVPYEKVGFVSYVKKIFNNMSTANIAHTKPTEPLIRSPLNSRPIVINRNMPASTTPEEISLLRGKMREEVLEPIELRDISIDSSVRSGLYGRTMEGVEETIVETDRGSLLVAIQGDRRKPAILTYHDLGLNYLSNFQAFFNFSEMRTLLENVCVYHVNAPGQEEGAATLPESYIYPSMDELANQLIYVLAYFGLDHVIGFGVGTGGNILARFAYNHPEKVEALCLMNVVSTQSGWIEWGYQKLNSRYLKTKGMTQGVLDYLMWHHFGRNTEERNYDLVQIYRNYFENHVNPVNLALFIDSYINRTDLSINRDTDKRSDRKASLTTLAMPVMNITGAFSPHVEDTVTLNGRLDPTKSTWMKISDCGMVLEEKPHKVCEALRLFLQGLGYAVRMGRSKYISSSSVQAFTYKDNISNYAWTLRITENPISKIISC